MSAAIDFHSNASKKTMTETEPAPPPKLRKVSLVKTPEKFLSESIPTARAVWLRKHLDSHPEILGGLKPRKNDFMPHEVYIAAINTYLEKICDAANDGHSEYRERVAYRPSSIGYGRLFARPTGKSRNKVFLSSISRVVRQTLTKGVLTDVDAVNCYPELIIQVCADFNYPCKNLKSYVEKRDVYISSWTTASEGLLSRDAIKEAVIRIVFGGGVSASSTPENVIPNFDPEENPGLTSDCLGFQQLKDFLIKLASEMKTIAGRFSTEVPFGIAVKDAIIEDRKAGNKKNPLDNIAAATLSVSLQIIENAMLDAWTTEYVKLTSHKCVSYCFDGFMAPVGTVTAEVLAACEAAAREATGFDLKLVEKEMKDAIEIPEEELSHISFLIDQGVVSDFLKGAKDGDGLDDEGEFVCHVEGLGMVDLDPTEFYIIAPVPNHVPVEDRTTDSYMGDSILRVAERFLSDCLERRTLAVDFDVGGSKDKTSGATTNIFYCRQEGTNVFSRNEHTLSNLIRRHDDVIVEERKIGDDVLRSLYAGNTRKVHEFIKAMEMATGSLVRKCENFQEEIIDACVEKTFFTNGYFDWKTGKFVPIEADRTAVSFYTTGYEFDRELFASFSNDHPIVKRIFEQILICVGTTEEERNYALRLFALYMAGRIDLKAWTVLLGVRNSGKGVLIELFRKAFGSGYVTVVSPPSIRESAASDSGAANREILTMKLHLARIAFSNEGSNQTTHNQNLRIDGNLMKVRASGGDRVICRNHYEGEVGVRVSAKHVICCNDFEIAGSADAAETVYPIKMPLKFAQKGQYSESFSTLKESDDSIKNWIKSNSEVGLAFFWILTKYWTPVAIKPSDIPKSAQSVKEIQCNVEENTDPYRAFCSLFKIDPNGSLPETFVIDAMVTAMSGSVDERERFSDPGTVKRILEQYLTGAHPSQQSRAHKSKQYRTIKAFIDSHSEFSIAKKNVTGTTRRIFVYRGIALKNGGEDVVQTTTPSPTPSVTKSPASCRRRPSPVVEVPCSDDECVEPES